MEERERIIIPDEHGDEHLFEVLFTFDVDETEESYVAVVPAEQADGEEIEVYAFKYEENENDDFTLYPIENDDEWAMVEEMLHTLADEEDIEL